MNIGLLLLGVLAGVPAERPVAWQPDAFPIGFWSAPPVTANTMETWQTVAEAHFTFVGPAGGYSVDENRRMLDFCERAGIQALVVDSRIHRTMVADAGWETTVDAIVADYGSHPALYGYYVQDEPNYQSFQSLGRINRAFLKRDRRHLPYINLFPTYASTRQLGTPTYADHLDKFLNIVRPLVLSYDHYCLLKDGHDRSDYFENLELIRQHAQCYNIPPWNIILVTPHLGYRDPTDAEMRWQVYTSLAYGMKGILYFTYWTHESLEQQGRMAIVDSNGKPTKHYPIVKQLNAEMRTLGKWLLSFRSIGVYHTGRIPSGCRRTATDLPIQLPDDEPLLLGLFKDSSDADYAMIVNRDHDKPCEIEVRLKGHVVELAEISATDGALHPVPITANGFQLSLSAGGGRLFRLMTRFDYPEPPRPVTKIDFGFDKDTEGWGSTNSMSPLAAMDGTLRGTITGADPYLTRGFLRVPADTYTKILIRMKLPKGHRGQLFWQTTSEPAFKDDKYVDFQTIGDDQYHEYQIDVGSHPKWRGQSIRAIRLDPAIEIDTMGETFEVDYIRAE